jgi:hypothetical protein
MATCLPLPPLLPLHPTAPSPSHAQASFVVTAANSSSQWSDVDLSGGEWFEYDEKAAESVSVQNIEHEFRLHKGG